MRVAAIGVGQAGGRIAELFSYHSLYGKMARNTCPAALAINTSEADLNMLKTIPKEDQLLIGVSQARGHGVGLVREMAATIARDSLPTIMREIARKDLHYIDAFWLVAGLGGGTGSGSIPVIARRLKETYQQPVYAIGVLPTRDEGTVMAQNAAAALAELHSTVDGTLVFDNDVWRTEGQRLEHAYDHMNHELVRPFPMLLTAGEASPNMVGIKVVDASDVIATWKDVAVIGYWGIHVDALEHGGPFLQGLPFFKKRGVERIRATLACSTVIRNAATKMSGEWNPGEAGYALMILAGRREHISMDGYSEARSWLQSTMPNAEIRAGDYPLRGARELSAVLLVGGIHSIPRLGVNLEEKR
ncbi:MAG: tubulin-like doman-containing protein [Chloroflexota bacterium]